MPNVACFSLSAQLGLGKRPGKNATQDLKQLGLGSVGVLGSQERKLDDFAAGLLDCGRWDPSSSCRRLLFLSCVDVDVVVVVFVVVVVVVWSD